MGRIQIWCGEGNRAGLGWRVCSGKERPAQVSPQIIDHIVQAVLLREQLLELRPHRTSPRETQHLTLKLLHY